MGRALGHEVSPDSVVHEHVRAEHRPMLDMLEQRDNRARSAQAAKMLERDRVAKIFESERAAAATMLRSYTTLVNKSC